MPLRDGDNVVLARVQHQCPRLHLPEEFNDVDRSPRLEQSSSDLRRRRLPTEIIEPAYLFIGCLRDESRGEYLAKGGIILAPSKTSEIDERAVQTLFVRIATAKRSSGVAAVQQELRD